MFKNSAFTKYKQVATPINRADLRIHMKNKLKKKDRETRPDLTYQTFKNASIRSNGQCSICIEFFVNPVTIQCGHTFCRQCLEQTLLCSTTLSCSLCRTNILSFEYNQDVQLAKFIDSCIVPVGSSKRQHYQYRLNLAEFLQRLRKVEQTIKIGDRVDILIEEWQNEEVQGIVMQDGKKCVVLQVDEITYTEQLSSRMIAISGFYTQSLREKWEIGFKSFHFDPKEEQKSMKERFFHHLQHNTMSEQIVSDMQPEKN